MKFVLEIELGERMESPSDVAWALEKVTETLDSAGSQIFGWEAFEPRRTIVGPDGLEAVGFWEVVESGC